MNLLSDEKIETLWQEHVLPGFGNQQKFISPTVFARAIEAAVLEAQAGQEPVAWAYTVNNSHSVFSAEKPPEDAYDEGTLYPLYAAPVVQPDMVMVPREPTDAMIDAAMNRYQHVSPEARLHFFQMHRENFRCDYKAMIAAAEGKSNSLSTKQGEQDERKQIGQAGKARRTGGASCAMMTETEKDRIWKIARNCGLLTKQPGTNAFDEALFAFVETVVRPTGGYLATGWTQDGMESRYCIDKRDADYFASFHPRNGTERMRNPNAKPGTVKALYVINNE